MEQKVYLIAMSKPSAVARDCYTAQDLVAYTARVSNPANQSNMETADKLVKYLIKHAHWSPFEMVHLTMGIDTTRDISRQILRHRSFSFQEFSQRYAESENFTTKREMRTQDLKNRQNSVETDDPMAQIEFERAQSRILFYAQKEYKAALKKGIAKEQARALLPEGLTGTTLYMAGSLRSWIHYIDLRAANGTQKEHMDIALQAKDIVEFHFPMLKEYWNEKNA